MKRLFYFSGILFLLLCHIVPDGMAAVFKCTDKSGKTTYSDKPCPATAEESVHHLPPTETAVRNEKLNSSRNYEFVRSLVANDIRRVRQMLVADPSLANAELPIGHNMFQVHALHIAAGSGHIQVVKELLEFKANPNYKDESRRTALFYAVGGMAPGVMDDHLKDKTQSADEKELRRTIGEVLIKAGAEVDVNAPIEHLATVAAYHNHVWLVNLYLQGPVDLNVLRIAYRWAKNQGSHEALSALKSYKADLEDDT